MEIDFCFILFFECLFMCMWYMCVCVCAQEHLEHLALLAIKYEHPWQWDLYPTILLLRRVSCFHLEHGASIFNAIAVIFIVIQALLSL